MYEYFFMVPDKYKYEVEFSCTEHDFWRFNLFIMVVGYNADGERVSFDDFTDRIYDLEYGVEDRLSPPDYADHRSALITTGECAYVEIYVYAVANTLPASVFIKDTPSFPARLKVTADNLTVIEHEYTVNPWGGLTIVALRADVRELKQ